MGNFFRVLVISATASFSLYLIICYFGYMWLSEEELDVLSWNQFGAGFTLPDWLAWILVLIWVPITFGMCFFVRIARTAYLLLSIFYLALYPFYGMFTASGLEFMFFQISTYLDGAVLALAYFGTIGSKFNAS